MDEMINTMEQPLQDADTDRQKWYKDVSLEDAKAIIKENIKSAAQSFIAIGYYLKHIRDKQLFTEDGYSNIWEFAKAEYGLSMSTASRYMTMNDRFSRDGNSPVIDSKYREFGKSQLQEMLSLDHEQADQVTPDMTVLDIRELAREAEEEIQIPGQIDISEFPEYMLEKIPGVGQPSQKSQTFVMSVEDMLQGVELGEGDLGEVIATSQQEQEGEPPKMQEEQVTLRAEIHDEAWFVSQWVKIRYPELERVMRACRIDGNMSDKAKAIQKELSPHGAHYTGCSKWAFDFHNFAGGMDFEIGAEKMHLKYGRFAEELLEMYNPWDSEFNEEEPEEIDDVRDKVSEEDKPEVIDGEFTEIHEPENLTDLEIAKEELERANDLLRKCLLVLPDENDIHIRRMKIKAAALAFFICDIDVIENPPPKSEQPVLPLLKNNDQRKEWLKDYQNWGMWYEDEHTGAKYYKYDFDNGARLIVEEYANHNQYAGDYVSSYMHLVGGPKPPNHQTGGYGKWEWNNVYNRFPNSETELIEFLKEIQKKG